MVEVLTDRLAEVEGWELAAGAHDGPEDGACVMEAVAYVAGEEWSDSPECASPVIAEFCRRWNDDLDPEGRQKLKPFISRLVGTAASPEIEERRGWMCADWLVRVHTPAELTGMASLDAARPAINEGKEKAAAAWDAARAAAWAAARDAARAAAWDAARAAADKKLEPTKVELQASARDLLDRMISLGEGDSDV